MTVEPEHSAHTAVHDGKTWHFCSEHCKSRFVGDPARYVKPGIGAEPPSSASHKTLDSRR